MNLEGRVATPGSRLGERHPTGVSLDRKLRALTARVGEDQLCKPAAGSALAPGDGALDAVTTLEALVEQ